MHYITDMYGSVRVCMYSNIERTHIMYGTSTVRARACQMQLSYRYSDKAFMHGVCVCLYGTSTVCVEVCVFFLIN